MISYQIIIKLTNISSASESLLYSSFSFTILVIISLHFFYDLCFSIQYSLVLQIRSYMDRVIGHVFFHGFFPSQLFLWDLAILPVAILYFNNCRVFHYMNWPQFFSPIFLFYSESGLLKNSSHVFCCACAWVSLGKVQGFYATNIPY